MSSIQYIDLLRHDIYPDRQLSKNLTVNLHRHTGIEKRGDNHRTAPSGNKYRSLRKCSVKQAWTISEHVRQGYRRNHSIVKKPVIRHGIGSLPETAAGVPAYTECNGKALSFINDRAVTLHSERGRTAVQKAIQQRPHIDKAVPFTLAFLKIDPAAHSGIQTGTAYVQHVCKRTWHPACRPVT